MNYNFAITRTDQYAKLRELSKANYKSAELWTLFSDSCSPVPEEVPVPDKYLVQFVTLIRTVWDNRVLVYGNNSHTCLRRTSVPLSDPLMRLDEACTVNAHAALTNSFTIDNPGMQLRYAESAMQFMGVVFHDDKCFVYLNVLVKDSVFDLVEDGDAHFDSQTRLVPIQEFTPTPDTLDALLWSSIVKVKGDTEDA